MSYLFISHDLTAVREVSHRVAIMYLGEIVEVGPNPDIFEQQIHPYGKALLSSVLYPDPDAPFGVVKLKGEIPSPVNLPSGCFLSPRCPYAQPVCQKEHPALIPFEDGVGVRGKGRRAACIVAQAQLQPRVLQEV